MLTGVEDLVDDMLTGVVDDGGGLLVIGSVDGGVLLDGGVPVVVDSVVSVVRLIPGVSGDVGEVGVIGVVDSVEDKLRGVDGDGVLSGVVLSVGHTWMHGLRSTTSYSVMT